MKRMLYAVIHAADAESGFGNAAEAILCGADGVALIDQFCDAREVERLARDVKKLFPTAAVLVNLLGNNKTAMDAAARVGRGYANSEQLCGLWCDGIGQDREALQSFAEEGRPLFAGVGFKYQYEDELTSGWNLAWAARLAHVGAPVVPMTSGPRTGFPPPLEKLQKYRQLLGPNVPLAVASGVTGENLSQMLPLATHFLVGTWIEDSPGIIKSERVEDLAAQIRAYNAKM